VEFAYAHVPYYRAILDDHGLTPQRLQSPHDLRDFPFLTREIVRTRFDDLRRAPNLPRVHERSSGGSTGVPVTVLVDMRRMGFVEAARMRAHRWFDVDVGAREIVLWASPIELTRQDSHPPDPRLVAETPGSVGFRPGGGWTGPLRGK